MRVSDEMLKTFKQAAAEAAEEDRQSPESAAMVSIIDELLALRKVADAAAALVLHALSGDGDRYQRDMPHYDALFIALKESGR